MNEVNEASPASETSDLERLVVSHAQYKPVCSVAINAEIETIVDFLHRKPTDFLFLFEDRPVEELPSYKWLRAIPSMRITMPMYIGNFFEKDRKAVIEQVIRTAVGGDAIVVGL